MKLHDLMRRYGVKRIEIVDGIAQALSDDGVEKYPALIVKVAGPEENRGEYTLSEQAIDIKLLDIVSEAEYNYFLLNELDLMFQAFQMAYAEENKRHGT